MAVGAGTGDASQKGNCVHLQPLASVVVHVEGHRVHKPLRDDVRSNQGYLHLVLHTGTDISYAVRLLPTED